MEELAQESALKAHKLDISKLPMAVVKPGNEQKFGRSIQFYIQKVNSDVNYIPVVISDTSDED